ncbi:MAG: hypothetical protein BM557_10040 [Flavobacterium sp. MedPE-SWcel]|uniref:DUF4870 domain-containing protein n=1 Tax=uncultured Flavobacterium sp. TaxID=165435 RepID=UPI0009202E2B|nr:DUF4870 domain-containing protein [uncultured Flavobacterium sp.]OIQ16202.1 MAG: hypothetical protein BM557_10040 [Flavobacterium sp. MedPE-SWcel]
MVTTADKNTSTLLQISTLTQYFLPLGNFIFPVLIWSLKKKDSDFIDQNGKQVINFQLSLLLYFMSILVVSIPFILYNVMSGVDLTISSNSEWVIEQFTAGKITTMVALSAVTILLLATLKIVEFCVIIYAAVKNSNGEVYKYPLTIKFIK